MSCPVILESPDDCVEVAMFPEECYPAPTSEIIYYGDPYMYGNPVYYALGPIPRKY